MPGLYQNFTCESRCDQRSISVTVLTLWLYWTERSYWNWQIIQYVHCCIIWRLRLSYAENLNDRCLLYRYHLDISRERTNSFSTLCDTRQILTRVFILSSYLIHAHNLSNIPEPYLPCPMKSVIKPDQTIRPKKATKLCVVGKPTSDGQVRSRTQLLWGNCSTALIKEFSYNAASKQIVVNQTGMKWTEGKPQCWSLNKKRLNSQSRTAAGSLKLETCVVDDAKQSGT